MHSDLGGTLRRRAWLSPKAEAAVDIASGRRMTFEAFNSRVNEVAHALSEIGIVKGDRVALLAYNGMEFIECLYAIAKLGATFVPLNWRLTAPELAFILGNCGARMLIFGTEFGEAAEEIHNTNGAPDVAIWIEAGNQGTRGSWALDYANTLRHTEKCEPGVSVQGSDPVLIMYTSGTTGLPKGAVHTHNTMTAAMENVLLTIDSTSKDRYLLALPLFHVGALMPLLSLLCKGVAMVLMRQFDPAEMWRQIETERITLTLAVPAMLNFMLKAPNFEEADYSTLASVLSGASPVPVALIETYHRLGIEIHQVYGMTETGGPGCYIGGADAVERAGSTGRGYLLTDIRVVDEEGRDVPAGTPGQVLVRGDHNMIGYWNNPQATAETLRDGWLHTGDIAIQDEEGFVTIHDRLKDMIISGGENVYPAEIENVLLSHADVADVAVIGQPSETWGECALAVVVSAGNGSDEADILDYCNGKLARFKQPKAVAFVEEIPRNPTGKPLKRILREQFPGPAPE